MKVIKNSKIALFGGSFNPIHIGHIICGFEIIEKLNYDFVIYIPLNIPVHKNQQDLIDPYHRINMVKLSIKGIKQFLYSDIEIKRDNISYTYDTLIELRKILNYNNIFSIVIGQDWLNNLSSWKDIDKINEISDFICLTRTKIENYNGKYKVKFVNNKVIDISSSEIRYRIRNNLPIDCFVKDNVKKYILKYNLYRV